jgi:hypothetical protein
MRFLEFQQLLTYSFYYFPFSLTQERATWSQLTQKVTSDIVWREAMCTLPWGTNRTLVSGQPVAEEAIPRTCPQSSGRTGGSPCGWGHRHRGSTGDPGLLANTVSCVVTPCGIESTRRHNPEQLQNLHHRENLISYTVIVG